MNRTAIVIGVDKAGDLPVLRAAATGAQAVADWARSQGYAVHLFTDKGGVPVSSSTIKAAIRETVASRTSELIMVYFGGHGILRGPEAEYWLLSDAKADSNEAVNVTGSVYAARNSGIPHVVFISDACRSRPSKAWQSNIQGCVVFPNEEPKPKRPAVDMFYATLPGDPAYELELEDAAQKWNGVFTATLLGCLEAKIPSVIEDLTQPPPARRVIPSWTLKDYLESAVADALSEADIRLQQDPEIRVESRPPKHLAVAPTFPPPQIVEPEPSRFSVAPDSVSPGRGSESGTRVPATYRPAPAPPPPMAPAPMPPAPIPPAPLPPLGGSRTSVAAAQVGLADVFGHSDSRRNVPHVGEEMAGIMSAASRVSFETRTGFTVTGSTVHRAFVNGFNSEVFAENSVDGGPNQVRVYANEGGPGASALIQFATGSGVCLPVLPGFIGSVLVQEGKVTAVNYTPSRGTWRFDAWEYERDEVEKLRAFSTVAMRRGYLLVEGTDPRRFAQHVRRFKNLDPTLGLYAAYAYAQAGMLDQVRDVYMWMVSEHGLPPLFDVAMLAGAPMNGVVPACPMLSQGWAILGDRKELLSPSMREAAQHLLPSLWTTFAARSIELLFGAWQREAGE